MRLSLSDVPSEVGMVMMAKVTKRDGAWILGTVDAAVSIKTTRAEPVGAVATVAVRRDKVVVVEAVPQRRAFLTIRRRGRRLSVGLRALAATNRTCWREVFWPTTAR